MESVYIETTVLSYLAARPGRNVLVAARQRVTRDWWARRRPVFACVASQVVLDEIAAGDPARARRRLEIARSLDVLAVTEDCESLARAILRGGAIPSDALRDAAHIAVAAVHDVDYLLTWNCAHLANAQIMRRVGAICNRAGYGMPVICTPEELMGV